MQTSIQTRGKKVNLRDQQALQRIVDKKSRHDYPFDKYAWYEEAVQYPEGDIDFINQAYQEHYGSRPKTLREDFSGTAMLACEWTRQSKNHRSWAVDLDPEPHAYGKEHHYADLSKDQQSRVQFVQKNVLDPSLEKTDIVLALNFSYFIFKQRKELLKYFKAARKGLNKKGMFIIDMMGGPESQTVMAEETPHDDFTYIWDCDKFNAITNECTFYIHFRPKGKKVVREVFTYDWRLWSMPELRDILIDAGFSNVQAYWEGDDGDGGGNGEFYQSDDEDNCDSWVSYLVATP